MGEALRVDKEGFLIGQIFVGILIHEFFKNVEHAAFK